MDKFKATLFIFLCLAMLLCSSCIYATDVNENATDTDNLQVDETATDAPDLEKNTNDNRGSFDELDNIIQNLKPGEVYTIDKDYCFNDADTTGRCISISTDNITINGNGHHFDGNNKAVTFNITGNNVNIFNFGIHNCQGYGQKMTITIDGNPTTYSTDMSPVYWKGANGTMSNCYLIKNSALNGGALTWTGSNGIINNTIFMNNTAKGAGGAIYLNGENTTITNTMFINSTSKLLNESIYLDRKQNSFNLDNIECDHLFCINGNSIGLDSDNLRKSYSVQFGGETIDLIPLIYTSFLGINTIDENTYYYGKFSSETHTFTLMLIRNYEKYGITYENEYVIHANSMDEIFADLASNFYTINTKIIKTVRVNTLNEYKAICHSNITNDILNTAVMDIIRNDRNSITNYKDLTYLLNVNYGKNAIFISNQQWDEDIGYDIIMVNGNGATVRAITEEGDEYHWISNTKNKTFAVSDLTIEGFNNAVINLNGTCIFTNVLFNNNGVDEGPGGAIVNAWIVSCINCTFTNNHAENGGAIFTQGLLITENCTFENNYATHRGGEILNIDDGVVIGSGNHVTNAKSITTAETVSYIICGIVTTVGITVLGIVLGLAAIGPGGILVGLAIGFAVGIAMTIFVVKSIDSRQYNLDYHTEEKIVEFTSDMTSMAIETAIATTEFFDDMKIHNAKIPNFKMNDDNEICVYIDGDYYKVGSEAMYINGTWVKKSDTVEIDGKYYPKENDEYLKNNEYGEKRINLGLKVEFENLDLFETLKPAN